jgi:hypothetical protein
MVCLIALPTYGTHLPSLNTSKKQRNQTEREREIGSWQEWGRVCGGVVTAKEMGGGLSDPDLYRGIWEYLFPGQSSSYT